MWKWDVELGFRSIFWGEYVKKARERMEAG
jgi:hypothetical protein